MTEYTLEASVKLGMIEYALVASVDPCGSLLAEGIAECHYTGPQPVTANANRFLIAITRLTYVIKRLTGKIYELILLKTRFKVFEFLNYFKMLAYWKNAFRNLDRV
jgi:hypothetical protein